MGRPKGSKNKNPETKAPAEGEVITPESGENQAVAILENKETPAPVPAVQENNSGREAALSIVGGVSTEQLKQALVVQTEQRKLIQQFIQDNLVEGIDYGKIHVIDSCPQEKAKRGSCEKDYHFSKSILFKPGQEKIFSLFGITDELEKDQDAYDVLQVPGMVAYKCIMYRGNNKVGEGRGAATLAESQNKPNSCIKKAEKRARMDAVLSLGFSAYFTQDLDDPDYKSQRDHMNEQAKHEAENRDKDEFGLMPRDPDEPIDNNERAILHKMLLKAGFSEQDEILELLKSNGVQDPKAMTSGQARGMMMKLKNSTFADQSNDDEPGDGGGLIIPPKPPEPMVPAELEVDDDLKQHIQEHYFALNLNTRGEWWFMKNVAGKPFGKFEKFEDKDWRRAFQFIEDIQEGRAVIDPTHTGKAKPEVPDNVDPETGEILDDDIDPRDDRDEDREIAQTAQTIFDDIDQTNNEEDN